MQHRHDKSIGIPDTLELPAQTALPDPIAGSGNHDRLADTARGYADHAIAENTRRAWLRDWAGFSRWCRLKGAAPYRPLPSWSGYTSSISRPPSGKARALSAASIKRHLAGLSWGYAQRWRRLVRRDSHTSSVLAGIRRRHARLPAQKDASGPDELRAMLANLDHDLRNRAMLLIGLAGSAGAVSSMHLKHVLRLIQTDCGDFRHDRLPIWIVASHLGTPMTSGAVTSSTPRAWIEVDNRLKNPAKVAPNRPSSDAQSPLRAPARIMAKPWIFHGDVVIFCGLSWPIHGAIHCDAAKRGTQAGFEPHNP